MWQELWNWAAGRGWMVFETHVRKSLDCLEQAISRNIDVDD